MVDDGRHQAKRREIVAPSQSSEFASTVHMQKPHLDRPHLSEVKQTAMLDQCQQRAPLPLPPPALWHPSHRQGQATEHDPASIKTQEALGTRWWVSSLPSPSPSEDASLPPEPVFCNEYSILPTDTHTGALPNQWPEPSKVQGQALSLPANILPGLFAPQTRRRHGCGSMNAPTLTSPFKDCLGSFGKSNHRNFARPRGGKINGYIKFSWPKGKQDLCASAQDLIQGRAITPVAPIAHTSTPLSVVPSSSILDRSTISAAIARHELGVDTNAPPNTRRDRSANRCRTIVTLPSTNAGCEPVSMPVDSPRKVPELFGYDAKMDATDRKLWAFYIRNWCPGRSVLLETNLWLKDFARMHKSDGVRAAIQSLAGIYIYDYLPIDSVRDRVNRRFFEAESCYSRLLADPNTAQNSVQASETITIATLLSMQDIVLTERRLKGRREPRWLSGFQQAEFFLQSTDQGSRFWAPSNIQLSSLHISQTVIVGRALILAQPMAPLPKISDPEFEANRFGWLLYGSEQDVFEVHGGCGFSRKLLHLMSQITYCAARLDQNRANLVVPITAEYLLEELLQMRQWSSESGDWEAAKAGVSLSDRWCNAPQGYKISSSADMTDVTAEAWRLAAILYLKCRVLRLPRNHPDVVSTLTVLATCVRVMPTSGFQFTAQAPLFPVFLLGLLATCHHHKAVSQTWFDEVVSTPVRSSVPPLYEALQRIWLWIGVEIELPTGGDVNKLAIRDRIPWWEQLVEQVTMREKEFLCLT